MARVLFIEDDAGWQKTIRRLLETAGHEAYYASTIDSALASLSDNKSFDVIAFDLRLGDKIPNYSTFLWLHAFVNGMEHRKMKIPPIVILTGVDISKDEIIEAFTEFRLYLINLFEKKNLDPKKFLSCINDAEKIHVYSQPQPKSFKYLLLNTLLIMIIMLIPFGILLWRIQQVPDPETQRTILQIGGAIIVIATAFIAVFSQYTKIESIMEVFTKVCRG